MNDQAPEYTTEEVQRLTQMHLVLTAYNDSLGTNDELPVPCFNDKEKAKLSRYYEQLLEKRAKGINITGSLGRRPEFPC
jgi:hypothetical protein